MRPLIVILLVAAALGAFYFAINMGGSPATKEPTGITPDTASQVTPQPAKNDPVELAQPEKVEQRVIETVKATADAGAVEHANLSNELTGLIVDEKGRGIKQARVTLTKFGSTAFFFADGDSVDRSSDRSVMTDKEGRYTFTGIEPSNEYSLKVRHPDYGPHEESGIMIEERGKVEEPRIVLSPGIELSGLVTDTAGNAVGGATVLLGDSAFGALVESGPDVYESTTDNVGHYSFKNVGLGNWTLSVSAAGYGRVTIGQVSISGDVSVEKDVTLQVASMIAGRVVNIGGEPLDKAKVQAFSLNQRSQQTRSTATTDKAGEFTLEDIPNGSYTLLVSMDGYKGERRQRIEAGDMGVLVELFPLPRVSGQVLEAASGKPLTKFSVRLREETPNSAVAVPVQNTSASVTDAEGRFEIACPKAGIFKVEGSSDKFASCFSESFTIAEGQNLPGVNVNMTVGGEISGRIVDSNGKPVRGATVSTHDKDWTDDEFMRAIGDMYPTMATTRSARTRADGTFVLKGLTPADYLLQVKHSDYSEVMKTGVIATEGGQAAAGDIVLQAGATVSGTVYDPSGAALVGAMIQMQAEVLPGQTPVSYQGKTDGQGQYTIEHVRAGTYFVNARRTAAANGNAFQHWQDQKQTSRKLAVGDSERYDGVDFRLGETGN